MEQGIQVDSPTYTEYLWHQNLRTLLIPVRGEYAFKCRSPKIVGNHVSYSAVPGSFFRRQAQLISHSQAHKHYDYCTPKGIPEY